MHKARIRLYVKCVEVFRTKVSLSSLAKTCMNRRYLLQTYINQTSFLAEI